MSNQIDLQKYSSFVEYVTSDTSKYAYAFQERFDKLCQSQEDGTSINPTLLITAGIGLSSETGEFNEIIKKMLFQGKPLNEENRFHMMRELGDIIWYWTNACRALGYNPNEVIAENVRKLETRYPGGKFDAWYSENRQDGDL
jgi:NTP pyrophosphatase (non-canonical NTP hydrolase)